MLSVFTAPKPFQGSIDTIQRNAIRSWKQLDPQVEVLLVGDEPGLAEAAQELEVSYLSQVQRNDSGTPLVSSIFRLARQHARHEVLCYVNADVILLDDLLLSIRRVRENFDRFLIVGQRWDLDDLGELDFGPGWRQALRTVLSDKGRLHPPAGSDYFVFPKHVKLDMPPFAIGRAGWDNWMIYAGRAMGTAVVDATDSITAIHQGHDYSHLPGGEIHYRLPESEENLRLAGGPTAIFTLRDAQWIMSDGRLHPGWRRAGLHRAMETWLIARYHPGLLAKLARALFHPVETVRYLLRKRSTEKFSPDTRLSSNP